MAIILPTYNNTSGDFQYTIEIENAIITLRYTWNVRNSYWYLDLTQENCFLQQLKIVPFWPLTRQNKAIFNCIEGDFICLKTNNNNISEITFDNFGIDYNIYYFTPEEIDEWEIANGLQ